MLNNPDTEAQVLGALLIPGTRRYIDECNLTNADFTNAMNAHIFDVLRRAHETEPVTNENLYLKISTRLIESHRTHAMKIIGSPLTGPMIPYAADQLKDLTKKRALLAGFETLKAGLNAGAEIPDVIARTDRMLIDATSNSGYQLPTAQESAQEALEQILDSTKRKVSPMPWTDINTALAGGLDPGTLTVIGAAPGLGKSALALNMCAHLAGLGKRTVYISLEMSKIEMERRLFAMHSGIDAARLKGGEKFYPEEETLLTKAAEIRSKLDIQIIDTNPTLAGSNPLGAATLGQIKYLLTMAARNADIGLVVIDHLHFVEKSDHRLNEIDHLKETVIGLKRLATRLNVPMVLIAPVNRASYSSGDRLTKQGFKGTSSIESDADIMIALNRDDQDFQDKTVGVDILKNRQGQEVQNIKLLWRGETMTFRDNYQAPFGASDPGVYTRVDVETFNGNRIHTPPKNVSVLSDYRLDKQA